VSARRGAGRGAALLARGAVLALALGVGAGAAGARSAVAAQGASGVGAAAASAGVAAPSVPGPAATGRPGPVVVVDDRGRAVSLAAPVRRVVSLLPSSTESVCALGACDRLVGVDRWSDFPAQAAALPRLGGLEDTLVERVVALRPDLVLAASSSRALARLESLGLTVLALEPRSFGDTRRVLESIARALGLDGGGEALWRSIEARIDAAAARVPASVRGARVYFEVSEAPHAAGEASFVGETLARLGLRNVVPASLGPFPLLNPEFVVRSAPELVIGGTRNVASMAGRPGWAAIPALRERRTCALDPARYDVVVRPGPRLAEAAESIADCIAALGGAVADARR
jgi:iron complex transport system substrate-binding protein